MKLENQVCTKEQAESIKRLGVIQKSLFYYHPEFERPVFGETVVTEFGKQYKRVQVCNDKKASSSAFTVAELGVLLPDYLKYIGNLEIGKCETDHVTMEIRGKSWWNVSYWDWDVKETPKHKDTFLEKRSNHLQQRETQAQAMAAMLINLLEVEFIAAEDCNKRLQKA